MNKYNNMKVDIAIIGGGIAGCTAAIALAKFYDVVLIDKLEKPQEKIGECLAPAAGRVLRQLDLSNSIEEMMSLSGQERHLKNIGTLSYWGNERVQIVDHLRNPDGFGLHLDRCAFETYMRETAERRGVQCVWPAKLLDANYEDGQWHLSAVTSENYINKEHFHCTATLVIDASGRQAQFARKLGIQRQHFDKLIACWATMPNNESNHMSTIVACEYGWWYSAPLPGNKRVMALQTDSDLIKHGIIKNAAQFMELIQSIRQMAQIADNSGGKLEYHRTVAANSGRLDQVAGKQWVALGDAAISFDPLSSQGMFNAMACSLQLAALVEEWDIIRKPNQIRMQQFEMIYSEQIDQIWKHYLKHKQLFYRQEMRWKDATFWQRRHF